MPTSKKQEARSKKQEARSKKQEARSKKQEARSKKQEARSKKQEARSELVCFDSANSPFAMATLTHLFALTASHFLSNATKSNQKTLRSHHPAPA
ncbi:hypothetical protein, partial [Pseudomonas putida]|uniref:hypothetical protein n=1 Tax=Pseudomonas putida TaxID=303 RepID=UPI0039E0836B